MFQGQENQLLHAENARLMRELEQLRGANRGIAAGSSIHGPDGHTGSDIGEQAYGERPGHVAQKGWPKDGEVDTHDPACRIPRNTMVAGGGDAAAADPGAGAGTQATAWGLPS